VRCVMTKGGSCKKCAWKIDAWIGEDGINRVKLCCHPQHPDGILRNGCPDWSKVWHAAFRIEAKEKK